MTRKGLCGQPSTGKTCSKSPEMLLQNRHLVRHKSLFGSLACVFFVTPYFRKSGVYPLSVFGMCSSTHVSCSRMNGNLLKTIILSSYTTLPKNSVIHDVEYSKVFKKIIRWQSRTWVLANPKASLLKMNHLPQILEIKKNLTKSTDSMQILEFSEQL